MKIVYLIIASNLLFASCATWEKSLLPQGNINAAVDNVIIDFLNTSKLSKVDSIFSINIQDNNDGVAIISIGGAVNKVYPIEENKVGTYDDLFPTQFVIKEGKLFYWNDSKKAITEEMLAILQEYDHIDFDWENEYGFPPIAIDDAKEGVIYYICKNNLLNYKKTGANTIFKQYKTPVLICD